MSTVPFFVSIQMNYGKEILDVLYEAGADGLSVHKISIHVHNSRNSLFDNVPFENVNRDVKAWLLRNSRFSDSLVCHCGKRGYYRLNLSSSKTRHLLLDFRDDFPDDDSAEKSSDNACQLSLFEDL